MHHIIGQLAGEIHVRKDQIRSAVELLDGGASVPFIARYRKEATGGLDDIQLREVEARLAQLRALDERRDVVLRSLESQARLTPELKAAIADCATLQALEDLYLPYKPRRRSRGQIACEAGLAPLAERLFNDPMQDPLAQAALFTRAAVEEGGADFSSVAAVLDGVRDILSERWAEDSAVVRPLREWLWQEGSLSAHLRPGQDPGQPEAARLRDYFDYQEPIRQVPSHRALAVFRGRTQELLDVSLTLPPQAGSEQMSIAESRIAICLGWRHLNRPADDLIRKAVAWTWRVKLSLSIERDLFARLREGAEQVAIKVFANNLRDLLLAAPAGARTVMGLDPGIRTGVKVAVVDGTGKLLETGTVFPHEPRRDWDGALQTLERLCRSHQVSLIAIGNGTASRETDQLATELLARLNAVPTGAPVHKVVVSEAGASVYSASAFASEEMPDVDVSLRGAASIARRLQDPLAELVKIEPRAIGVGQYQHDLNAAELARALNGVVEDCVNRVGVDLNTASVPLLARVSGLSTSVARSLVRWREAHGPFRSRQQLLEVSGLGPRTFEQCAGFLRIRDGEQPLDMTGVHPETYPVVERIMRHLGRPVAQIIGHADVLRAVSAQPFADERFGEVTVRDILAELEKPGRDPRPDFQIARFTPSVAAIQDLKADMVIEGTVSNVAAFGAFVDLGVHQDGLVHVSQLSQRFVKDAREIVKTGDRVRVRVLEVDLSRKRIALSMKLDVTAAAGSDLAVTRFEPARHPARTVALSAKPARTVMAAAFDRLKRGSH